MTKQDYELVAAAINRALNDYQFSEAEGLARGVVQNVATHIAQAMEGQNVRFNYYTFMKACGLEDKWG